MTDRVAEAKYLEQIELRSLHLHSARHERGAGSLTDEVDLTSTGDIEPYLDEELAQLTYLVSMEYRIGEPEGAADDALATGAVQFAVTYDLIDGLVPTEAQCREFAYAGVVFQVHPYIREHVASMCTRSGIPPFMLPMLLHDASARDAD